jgi:hypothetical protein
MNALLRLLEYQLRNEAPDQSWPSGWLRAWLAEEAELYSAEVACWAVGINYTKTLIET